MDEFIDGLVEIFRKDLKAVIVREMAEPGYLPQEDFKSCLDRAKAGILDATIGVSNTLGYSITLHEEKEHGADTLNEQASLLAEESTSVDVGTREFWSS